MEQFKIINLFLIVSFSLFSMEPEQKPVVPLSQDEYTQALVSFAQRYTQDPVKNADAFGMFDDLWKRGDNSGRSLAVSEVLELTSGRKVTQDDCLKVYAGNAFEELRQLQSQDTPLARTMLKAAKEYNSAKIKRLLLQQEFLTVKTMLLAKDLLFDCNWSPRMCSCERKHTRLDSREKKTALELALLADDSTIISSFLGIMGLQERFLEALRVLQKRNRIDLLEAFLKDNYAKIQKVRFSIWMRLIRKDDTQGNDRPFDSQFHNQFDAPFLKQFVMLLFPDLSVQDESGESLMSYAHDSPYDHVSRYAEQVLLELACKNGGIALIDSFLKKAKDRDKWYYMLNALKRYHRIDLLELFINKYHKKIFKQRSVLWDKFTARDDGFILIKDDSKRDKPHDLKLAYSVLEKIVELLFPDIDALEDYGDNKSALLYAVKNSHADAVRAVLARKANPNIAFPLYCAYDKPEITSLLLAAGADINQRDKQGRPAIMAAISSGRHGKTVEKVIEQLLIAGADVDATDDEGRTVLHKYAADKDWVFSGEKQKQFMTLFFQYGANPHMADKKGKIPIDYAQMRNNTKMVELLQAEMDRHLASIKASFRRCALDVEDELKDSDQEV